MPTAYVFICIAWRGDPSTFYRGCVGPRQKLRYRTAHCSCYWRWMAVIVVMDVVAFYRKQSTRGHSEPGAHHGNIWPAGWLVVVEGGCSEGGLHKFPIHFSSMNFHSFRPTYDYTFQIQDAHQAPGIHPNFCSFGFLLIKFSLQNCFSTRKIS